jgi:hypothetical protein
VEQIDVEMQLARRHWEIPVSAHQRHIERLHVGFAGIDDMDRTKEEISRRGGQMKCKRSVLFI